MKLRLIIIGLLIVGLWFYNPLKSADESSNLEGLFKGSLPEAGDIKASLEDGTQDVSTFYFKSDSVTKEEIQDFLGSFNSPDYSIVKLGEDYYIIFLPSFNEELSEDVRFLLISGKARESKAFLTKYPEATVHPNNEEGVVEYLVMQNAQSTIRGVPPYIKLRVFIDTDEGIITSKVLECWDGVTQEVREEEEILKYLQSSKCLI